LHVYIDTSSHGFDSTPLYIPSVVGLGKHFKLLGTNTVYDASATGFRIVVYNALANNITPQHANDWQWHVNWIAIEQ
jgi:hypothetical protein